MKESVLTALTALVLVACCGLHLLLRDGNVSVRGVWILGSVLLGLGLVAFILWARSGG